MREVRFKITLAKILTNRSAYSTIGTSPISDFVYALHDFYPENVDEIAFKAGDRIEVVEKNDFVSGLLTAGRFTSRLASRAPQAAPTIETRDINLDQVSIPIWYI